VRLAAPLEQHGGCGGVAQHVAAGWNGAGGAQEAALAWAVAHSQGLRAPRRFICRLLLGLMLLAAAAASGEPAVKQGLQRLQAGPRGRLLHRPAAKAVRRRRLRSSSGGGGSCGGVGGGRCISAAAPAHAWPRPLLCLGNLCLLPGLLDAGDQLPALAGCYVVPRALCRQDGRLAVGHSFLPPAHKQEQVGHDAPPAPT
jgi:hypothetical protein